MANVGRKKQHGLSAHAIESGISFTPPMIAPPMIPLPLPIPPVKKSFSLTKSQFQTDEQRFEYLKTVCEVDPDRLKGLLSTAKDVESNAIKSGDTTTIRRAARNRQLIEAALNNCSIPPPEAYTQTAAHAELGVSDPSQAGTSERNEMIRQYRQRGADLDRLIYDKWQGKKLPDGRYAVSIPYPYLNGKPASERGMEPNIKSLKEGYRKATLTVQPVGMETIGYRVSNGPEFADPDVMRRWLVQKKGLKRSDEYATPSEASSEDYWLTNGKAQSWTELWEHVFPTQNPDGSMTIDGSRVAPIQVSDPERATFTLTFADDPSNPRTFTAQSQLENWWGDVETSLEEVEMDKRGVKRQTDSEPSDMMFGYQLIVKG